MKVLVLSDTHGLLRPEVSKMLSDCDAVIHAGDFHTQKVMDEIRTAVRRDTPVFMVKGNNDGRWASALPEHMEMILDHVKFYVVHDRKDLPQDLKDSKVVIFGHSHKYLEEWKDGRLYLNPGSCGRKRFKLDLTMAVLYLEDGKISVERIDISDRKDVKDGRDARDVRKAALPDNLPGTIRNIMKRMDKGWQIDRISKELGLERDFVEDVCRIRVTHPGVSAEGILNKMEANNS